MDRIIQQLINKSIASEELIQPSISNQNYEILDQEVSDPE